MHRNSIGSDASSPPESPHASQYLSPGQPVFNPGEMGKLITYVLLLKSEAAVFRIKHVFKTQANWVVW